MKRRIQHPHTELYWNTATRACVRAAYGDARLDMPMPLLPNAMTGLSLSVSYLEDLHRIFISEVRIVFFFAALSSSASSIKHTGNAYGFPQQGLSFQQSDSLRLERLITELARKTLWAVNLLGKHIQFPNIK